MAVLERDAIMVQSLLGRPPMGSYTIALRRHDRSPVVVANQPLFKDGRPMPTRFWLCDSVLVHAISQLESDGGVKEAERSVGAERIRRTHRVAAAERDALIPTDYDGPRPFGGVGGTRQGVKCLHTHAANYLAGAPDAVGEWTMSRLEQRGLGFDPSQPGIGST